MARQARSPRDRPAARVSGRRRALPEHGGLEGQDRQLKVLDDRLDRGVRMPRSRSFASTSAKLTAEIAPPEDAPRLGRSQLRRRSRRVRRRRRGRGWAPYRPHSSPLSARRSAMNSSTTEPLRNGAASSRTRRRNPRRSSGGSRLRPASGRSGRRRSSPVAPDVGREIHPPSSATWIVRRCGIVALAMRIVRSVGYDGSRTAACHGGGFLRQKSACSREAKKCAGPRSRL